MAGSVIQDYLKAIYKLRDENGSVSPSAVADRLEVSPPAVTKMVKRMAEMNLVHAVKNQRVSLTPSGEKIALEVIRHHRLLEAYLKEALGYTWDQVDAEAEKLEHVISEEFEEKIDQFLGCPSHDPHGDPIPTKDGRIEQVLHPTLTDLMPGQAAIIRRVSDSDPQMLRYLGELGLYPNTQVTLLDKEPYGGSMHILARGIERAIGRELADQVFVTLLT